MDEEKQSQPAPSAPAAPPTRSPAAWGDPLFRLDQGWTRFETWLAVLVIGLEAFALSLWVFLKGLSSPYDADAKAGLVFRAIIGAFVLGMIAYHALRKQKEQIRVMASIGGVVLGVVTAKAWVAVGVDYSSNLLNWYQQASSLALFGGLRGIGTRLTLLLALLGGSLATASGKHITVDFLTRFLSDRTRVPVVLAGWIAIGSVCFVASWGFFDHIAIENFGAKAEMSRTQKIAKVGEGLEEHFFILRKQVSLDLKATPHVLAGDRYADWLGAAEWNTWVDEHGFAERYGAESLDALKIPEGETRAPFIIIPEVGEPKGELVNAANLVFPIGLLIIAIRFFLRSALVISGHVSADPEEGGEFSSDRAEEGAK